MPPPKKNRYTYQYVKQRLELLLKWYTDDLNWLDQNAEDIYRVIGVGLNTNSLFLDSSKAMLAVMPYMLQRENYRNWQNLVYDALASVSALTNDALRIQIYILLAQCYILCDETKPARDTFTLAMDIARDREADDLLLKAFIGLLRTETYERPEPLSPTAIEAARKATQKVGDDRLSAWFHQAVAAAYAHRGETQQAMGYGFTALGYCLREKNSLEIVKTTLTLLVAAHFAYLPHYTERLLRLANEHLPHTPSLQLRALVTYEIGCNAHFHGRYATAVEKLARASELFDRLKWARHSALAHHALGLAHIELQSFDEAQSHLEATAKYWERHDNPYEAANIQHALGYLEIQRGNRIAGLAILQQAKLLCQAIPQEHLRQQLEALIDDDLNTL
jgi:tetratricopeptide (TPR) repeat protein